MPGIRALGGLCEIIQIMYDIDVSQSTTQKYLVPIIVRTILRLFKIIQDLYYALMEIARICMILMVAVADYFLKAKMVVQGWE